VPVPIGMGMTVRSEPCGLDFGAVMMVATAAGADTALVADVLPAVEQAILLGQRNDEEAEDMEDDG
jgi:hypothetical protein